MKVPKRAFGITLEKYPSLNDSYGGERDGAQLWLKKEDDGSWLAWMSINSVTVHPHLTSASPAAAIRNLRGHLANLALSLGKLI